jgi:ABC-type lipoprotein release transport system permease subunit
MNKELLPTHSRFTSYKVGWFLGIRQIKRANIWTTILIVFIMMLTFLNMVAVSGILIGLIVGGNVANKNLYTSDVLVATKAGKKSIDNSHEIISTLSTIPAVERYSARMLAGGTVEAGYVSRYDFSKRPDTAGTQVAGIDIAQEEALTGISKSVAEGEFLDPDESGYVVLGANLLQRYSSSFGEGFDSLDRVYPGDRVRITVDGNTAEFTVKGIINSKVGDLSLRAFLTQADFVRLTGRTDLRVNEIAVKHIPEISDDRLKQILLSYHFDTYAKVQTATEAIPQFLDQIKTAFGLLGNVIGAIGIIVASITIFIVVFINAVTRRKFIGILKGIGVEPGSIRFAYVLQALFYALLGSGIGMIVLYAVLVPGLAAHPLDFPFSDGILVAPAGGTIIRLCILLLVSLVAGFLPAWMIVRKNTLSSILGR